MFKKVACLFFALLTLLSSFMFGVDAAFEYNPMAYTDVEYDLEQMNFDPNSYKLDTSADYISLIDFLEYGYHEGGNQEYYGLYIYLYNPSGKTVYDGSNSVGLSYSLSNGSMTRFAKYKMELLSVSYDNRLLKFRIADSSDIGALINSARRVYEISSIELQFDRGGHTKPVDNVISSRCIVTGYQSNFDKLHSNADTLKKYYETIEVISVELRAASWYSRSSDLGEDYRYEVSSVYFNVPNYFIEKYGNIDDDPKDGGTSGLYSVQGEYYKYVTDGLIVPDEELFNRYSIYVNEELHNFHTYENSTIGGESVGFFVEDYIMNTMGTFTASYLLSYNMFVGNYSKGSTFYEFVSPDINNHICNLAISTGDDTMYLSQEDFLATYNRWGRNHYTDTGGLSLKNADVFKGLGKVSYEISVDDGNLGEAIKTYASSKRDGFGKWMDKLLNKDLYDDEGKVYDIAPIVEIEASDIGRNMEPATIADNLYVMVENVQDIKDFYDEYSDDNHIYLMRLEVNPYYAPEVMLACNDSPDDPIGTGIYFEKAIFEDIDILEFTFVDKNNKKVTVPVSCDPIDNVGAVIPGNNAGLPNQNDPDATSRDDSMDWWLKFWEWFKDQEIGYKILIVIVIIIVIMLLIRLVGALLGVGSAAIVKAMGTIVAAPFRAANNVRKRALEMKAKDSAEKAKREARKAEKAAKKAEKKNQ